MMKNIQILFLVLFISVIKTGPEARSALPADNEAFQFSDFPDEIFSLILHNSFQDCSFFHTFRSLCKKTNQIALAINQRKCEKDVACLFPGYSLNNLVSKMLEAAGEQKLFSVKLEKLINNQGEIANEQLKNCISNMIKMETNLNSGYNKCPSTFWFLLKFEIFKEKNVNSTSRTYSDLKSILHLLSSQKLINLTDINLACYQEFIRISTRRIDNRSSKVILTSSINHIPSTMNSQVVTEMLDDMLNQGKKSEICIFKRFFASYVRLRKQD